MDYCGEPDDDRDDEGLYDLRHSRYQQQDMKYLRERQNGQRRADLATTTPVADIMDALNFLPITMKGLNSESK